MTNLTETLRERLNQDAVTTGMSVYRKYVSKIDGTVKYLFLLHDGNMIESVVMKHDYGRTICVSSQAGCAMGCGFCASALKGLSRDLDAGEMLGQVILANADAGARMDHIVIMGSGEPFMNYGNTVKFIRLANDKEGLNIGIRNISVSTCGIADKMLAFATKGFGYALGVASRARRRNKGAK
jgi:23S rRNA (adenine2503-C2)-methyltransferase